MTTKRTKPAADEAACPVAPLAREFARCMRALEKLDDDKKAQPFVEATTMTAHELGPTPKQARRLIHHRRDAIQAMARQLPATSRLGLAFQLLVIYSDNLHDSLTDAQWEACPQSVRDQALQHDQERQGIIWSTYQTLAAGMQDDDLSEAAGWIGSHALTDAESTNRMLQAVA
jgi:hypothetical protein